MHCRDTQMCWSKASMEIRSKPAYITYKLFLGIFV
jgi:hypothetical protein